MYKYNISYDSIYHYFLNLVKKKASISCGTGVCSQLLHFQSILLHNTAMMRSICIRGFKGKQTILTHLSCIMYD